MAEQATAIRKAESLFRQASEIVKKALGENHPYYATSLNNLALLYLVQGDDRRAEPLCRQALEIQRKLLGENHPDYARSLNNLASLYRNQGDYRRAEPLFRQASEIYKNAHHSEYATSLNNLAERYLAQGDYARAEPLIRQVSEIVKKAPGENHPDYANSLTGLASLYHSQGDYRQAEPLIRQASEILKKALGENHPEYATSLHNLALLYRDQGDNRQAEPLFRQALEIRKKALGENHPDYADSLDNLAALYYVQGDYRRAEPLFRQAVEIIRRHIEATSIVQSERQQLAMLQDSRNYLDGYLNLAAGSGRFAAAVYGESLAWKGIVLRRNRLARAGTKSPELLETFTRLQRLTTQLARLAWATPDPKQETNWQERTAKLSAEKEQLEADLSARSAEYGHAKRQVAPEEVQAALPQNAVLIDFVEYRCLTQVRDKAGTKEPKERRLLGFIVAPNRPVEMVPLGPMQIIEEAIETWRAAFAVSPNKVKATRDKGAAAGQLLRQLIWEPLEPLLAGAKTVLVSPDGALGRFPIAALPGKQPNTYLLDQRAIAPVPVPQLIPEIVQDQARKPAEKNLLMLGDIDYNSPPADAKPQTPNNSQPFPSTPLEVHGEFNELPGMKAEIDAIEKVHQEVFGNARACTTLRRSQASKLAFLTTAAQYRYLHVSTHGFFVVSKPLPNPMQVASRGGLRLGEIAIRPEAGGMHPAPLSGLALAGANRTGKRMAMPSPPAPLAEGEGGDAASDDGILTAEEIGTQNLEGVDVIMLSACETGLGKASGGEGLLGLQRAFHSAGASNGGRQPVAS